MKDYLTIKNDQGEEKEYEILLSFDSDEDHKKYVTYTDYTKDEDGAIICYSSVLEDDGHLSEITNEKAKETINELLNTLIETTNMRYFNKE